MGHRLLAGLLALALLMAALPPPNAVRAVGSPLYPDLRTAKPSSLYFTRVNIGGSSHYVLRFSNIVWNAGEGRLELQGDPNPNGSNRIYQNIYDQRSGGTRVSQRQISSDIIYHPSHFHYHFEGFASYLLLQRDSAGVYKATTKKGTKTSFCVMDTARMTSSAGGSLFSSCGNNLQGLTVGWGDEYPASLPEQWIDVGTVPLADGAYAIQSTADPQNKLAEGGRDSNNVGLTYFTVRGGSIYIGSTPSAACGVNPTSVTVASYATLTCSTFRAGETVRIYFDSTSSTPITSTVATSSGALSKGIRIPEARAGSHALIAVGASSGSRATGAFTVKPSLTRSPDSGPAGSGVTVTVHGFGSGEEVKLNWNTPSGPTLARLNTDGRGRGSVRIAIPNDTLGWHDYTGFGYTSRQRAYGAIKVLSGYPGGTADPTYSGASLPIVASSGSSNANSSTRVHDRNTSTSWETTTTAPPTIAHVTVDLGERQRLSGIKWVYRVSRAADEVLIQTSTDGVSWSTVGRFGNAPAGSWRGAAVARDGRYVRFTFLNPNSDVVLGYLAEVQVWGQDQLISASGNEPDLSAATTTTEATSSAEIDVTATAPLAATSTIAASIPVEAFPTGTPDPTDAATPTPEPPDRVIATGRIAGTGGDGAVCRTAPSPDAAPLALLPDGTLVEVTGAPVDGFLPIRCADTTGFVFGDFVAFGDVAPTPPETPVATEPVVVVTPTPTATPDPIPEPTPAPVRVVREVVVPVSADTSVSAADPDTPQPAAERTTLTAGGETGSLGVLTFAVDGVEAGTVLDARLLLSGSGERATSGGSLAVLPGVRVDAETATYRAVAAAGLIAVGPLDPVAPGQVTSVDVSGVVRGDGTVTFVVLGPAEAVLTLASAEGGAPARLVLTVEEWVLPTT